MDVKHHVYLFSRPVNQYGYIRASAGLEEKKKKQKKKKEKEKKEVEEEEKKKKKKKKKTKTRTTTENYKLQTATKYVAETVSTLSDST